MKTHKSRISARLLCLAIFALCFGISQSFAQTANQGDKKQTFRGGKLTTAERKAAAKRAAELGLKPGVAGLAAPMAAAIPLSGIEGPGGTPHYFGPYGNWAFSPLPKGELNTEVTVDSPGEGYAAPVVTIMDAYDSAISATASATLNGNGEITQISITSVTPIGALFRAPVVIIEDTYGTGAAATATLNTATLTGGIQKFVDGLPGLGPDGANNLGQYIPVAVPEKKIFSGQEADYYEIALVEYKEQLHSNLPETRLRGYVQLSTPTVPGANIPLFQVDGVTPILMPDGITQAHAVDKPHYLGPTILARGRVHGIQIAGQDPGDPVPVRVKFYNLLPKGEGGNLFLPVDKSVMGAGYGPAGPNGFREYTQNRATIHLHGNNTIWLSDGNVHQWITPAGEDTPYPAGVSARNVPDMDGCTQDSLGDPLLPGNSGCMTFYYTNAQSARLQFYHDHAMGITRLNVYAGEAAGYLLTDAVEEDMINGTNLTGVNPGLKKVLPGLGIPLIIQDKTFVDGDVIFAQDPTWNWGTGSKVDGKITGAITGDLWYPHTYMTVQNPWDLTGTNAFGKWHYGPWFNPPTPACTEASPAGCIEVGPVPNPYYQPVCDGLPDGVNSECTAPWEPPLMPGVPNPSMPGESFFDTQLVNGTAYPYVELEPKAYRFRVLNASNDRFVNLQLYVAADKTTPTTALESGTTTKLCDGSVTDQSLCTEVKMVPVSVLPANQFADTPSGVPDPTTAGPAWWMIGTEGGFLPKPVVVPQKPIGYNMDTGYFSFGIVNQHSLYLGAAERADVVVDFSAYAGKTLILYNDSPAPVPAGAAPFDNYTGNGNQMDSGAAPNTQPGYGPNIRTIMQIRIGTTVTEATSDVNLANLRAVFEKTTTKRGVFEISQDPIIIPQAAYNSAYNASFPTSAVQQYVQIADTAKTFRPINEQGVLQSQVTLPLEMKAMHDEMGGVYDTMFGRMSGMLGLSILNSPIHVLIPYGLASPPTDLVKGSLEATPIGVMPDGTQIWRIFHNGVDTHPIHTHLFHAQLINRVDQSGQITAGTQPVDPTELGWKDTFKINPLEVTYLAMRPTVPMPDQIPFEVPDSIRLIDPTLPEGEPLIPPPPAGWFDPAGNNIPQILNHKVNFGWEYVWHCHILSHEEMDMMHTLVFVVPPAEPTNLALVGITGTGNNQRVNLQWNDNSGREERFTIQRAKDAGFSTELTTFDYVNPATEVPNVVSFQDSTARRDNQYWYRVFAVGRTIGDTQVYPTSPNGFPTMSANSVSNTLMVSTGDVPPPPTVPANPTNLTATVISGPQVSLAWTDNSNNETGFVVERCTGAGCTNFAPIATTGTDIVTFVDNTVVFGNSYSYRVFAAIDTVLSSAPTNTASVLLLALPANPTNLTATVLSGPQVNLAWTDNSNNETGFVVERCTGAGCTNFALIVTTGPNTITFADASVAYGNSYSYRVFAVIDTVRSSAPTNTASVLVPAIPAAPGSFTVSVAKAARGPNYTATLNWTNAGDAATFTIERATNAAFSAGLASFTAAGTDTSLTQTVNRRTTYYYRIRANNNIGGSSAWVNATPFPISAGN